MARISNDGFADMPLAYDAANGSSRELVGIYGTRLPSRHVLVRQLFAATHRRLRDTG